MQNSSSARRIHGLERTLIQALTARGFVYAVMKNFGISPTEARLLWLQTAFMLTGSQPSGRRSCIFDTTNATNQGYISHVGIYMGDGNIIHSSSGKQWGVTINSLSEPYYNTKYVTARRVLR